MLSLLTRLSGRSQFSWKFSGSLHCRPTKMWFNLKGLWKSCQVVHFGGCKSEVHSTNGWIDEWVNESGTLRHKAAWRTTVCSRPHHSWCLRPLQSLVYTFVRTHKRPEACATFPPPFSLCAAVPTHAMDVLRLENGLGFSVLIKIR